MVGERWLGQRDALEKQCGDGIGFSDGTRGEHGGVCFLGDSAIRTDRLRGNSVGVADIGAMPCGAWGSGDGVCGDDDG